MMADASKPKWMDPGYRFESQSDSESGELPKWYVEQDQSNSLIDSILERIRDFLSDLDTSQLQGVRTALDGMGITAKRAGMAAAGGALAAVAAKQYKKRRQAKQRQAKQRQAKQQGQAEQYAQAQQQGQAKQYAQAWQLTSNEVAEAFGPNDVY